MAFKIESGRVSVWDIPVITRSEEDYHTMFHVLDHLPESALVSMFDNVRTLMQIRRRRLSPMPLDRLYRHILEETDELDVAMRKPNIIGITPEIAHELADIAYYRLEPSIPSREHYFHWFESSDIKKLGVPRRIPISFGIMKYAHRVAREHNDVYKNYELYMLDSYLRNHPELANLWWMNGRPSRSEAVRTWMDIIFDHERAHPRTTISPYVSPRGATHRV